MAGVKAGISLTVMKHIIALPENYSFQEMLLFKFKNRGNRMGLGTKKNSTGG